MDVEFSEDVETLYGMVSCGRYVLYRHQVLCEGRAAVKSCVEAEFCVDIKLCVDVECCDNFEFCQCRLQVLNGH